MKIRRSTLLALAALALGSLFTGCATDATTTDTSNIPWNRPATWEGGIPGMSNAFGGASSNGGNGMR